MGRRGPGPVLRVDWASGWIWPGGRRVRLTPKAAAVLRALARSPGRLVGKEEIVGEVWSGAAVSDDALKFCIRQIRLALGDDAADPKYLETVHRRGYRLLARMVEVAGSGAAGPAGSADRGGQATRSLVGRDAELARLDDRLAHASRGERQIVLVAGEAGIGKTTLVEAFAAARRRGRGERRVAVAVGFGQCTELHGETEPFLPFLQALDGLAAGPGGAAFVERLRERAPLWLLQLPRWMRAGEHEALLRRTHGAPPGRMLRELGDVLGDLEDTLVVLVIEDLHWSDPASVDALLHLVRRREPTRLLLVATHRPAHGGNAVFTSAVSALKALGRCTEITLGGFGERDVERLLRERLATPGRSSAGSRRAARALVRRTGGNPLFVARFVDDRLLGSAAGAVRPWSEVIAAIEGPAPESVERWVHHEWDRLDREARDLLGAASVVGDEFSSASVGAALQRSIESVESALERLVETHPVVVRAGAGAAPDGTTFDVYRFRHALYRELGYRQIPAGRRSRWHRRIGDHLEARYGDRARSIAGELAVHFREGGNRAKALLHLRSAADNALERSAYPSAARHVRDALELVAGMPPGRARDAVELRFRLAEAATSIGLGGYGTGEAREAYARARALSRTAGERGLVGPTSFGLWRFHTGLAEHETALEIARSGARGRDRSTRTNTEVALGISHCMLGNPVLARRHLEHALAAGPSRSSFAAVGENLAVAGLGWLCWTLSLLGERQRALAIFDEMTALADRIDQPFSRVEALVFAARFEQFHERRARAAERADEILRVSGDHGFALFAILGDIFAGSARSGLGSPVRGARRIEGALRAFDRIGTRGTRTHFSALLAEARGRAGECEKGLAAVDEGLRMAEETGERMILSELHRVRGRLLLQRGRTRSAEAEGRACFEEAIRVARTQRARALEGRARADLARLDGEGRGAFRGFGGDVGTGSVGSVGRARLTAISPQSPDRSRSRA